MSSLETVGREVTETFPSLPGQRNRRIAAGNSDDKENKYVAVLQKLSNHRENINVIIMSAIVIVSTV